LKFKTTLTIAACSLMLSACGDILSVSEAERQACDKKVADLTGRKAVGEEVFPTVHNHNGTKSIRLIYKSTTNFPGVQCDMVAGKVTQILSFQQIYPETVK